MRQLARGGRINGCRRAHIPAPRQSHDPPDDDAIGENAKAIHPQMTPPKKPTE
jgi:hypothetical protein